MAGGPRPLNLPPEMIDRKEPKDRKKGKAAPPMIFVLFAVK